MADVLARIAARKRHEVSGRLDQPLPAFSRTLHSLTSALRRPGARFIMEMKRASPSGHRSSLALEQVVGAYRGVADAISVLIDGPDFGGSLDDLRSARAQFAGPILAKDFFVHPIQVAEARGAGADAILVMLSLLDDAEAASMLDEAQKLGMETLVEIHDEAELFRALQLGATLIGINNRDLKTLDVDLTVTERLAPLIPPSVTIVSESGIASRSDVNRLTAHADSFLVGSALMSSRHIRRSARALVHGHTKVCGLTRGDDVLLAAECGATHAGFIMAEGGARAIDRDRAKLLAGVARRAGLASVGVFQAVDVDFIAGAAQHIFDAVQLHAAVSDADIIELRSKLPYYVEIWTLCPVSSGPEAPPNRSDRTLFDTNVEGVSGGTGRCFDWSLIKNRPDLPASFLAGGINAGNAAAAALVGAYGLDVCSGMEIRPGIKDPSKVRALFEALRPASRPRS